MLDLFVKRKIFWLVPLVLLIEILWLVYSGLVIAEVKNETTGNLKPSMLWANLFVIKEGYWGKVNRLKITYLSKETRNGMVLTNGADGKLVQSVEYFKEGRTLIINAYYNPEKINGLLQDKNWLNRDVWASLCASLDQELTNNRDGCYMRASEFERWLMKTLRVSWLQVSPVYATGCEGTVGCGYWSKVCTCVGDESYSCSQQDYDCGSSGTCNCTTECIEKSTLQCSGEGDQTSCQNTDWRDCNGGSFCQPPGDLYSCEWCGSCGNYGSCYAVGNSCVKSGSDLCKKACWDYCTAAEAGCTAEDCPTTCGYGGGEVNNGNLGTGCGCATKSCPATASCCTATNPDKPALTSPAIGAEVNVGQAVSLGWNAISNWGTGCPSNNNRYEVCVMSAGTTCDLVNNVSTGTNTSYSWTPAAADTSVSWRVRSNNGSNQTNSDTRTVCVEGGTTLGAWSACDANHKRTRTCTETCGTDDCTALGAVGGVITEDCIGTITGTLFDASVYDCTNFASAEKFVGSSVGVAPDTAGRWPTINSPIVTNGSGVYTASVYASNTPVNTYSLDLSAVSAAGVRYDCGGGATNIRVTDSNGWAQTVTRNFGIWKVYGGWWQAQGGSVYARSGVDSNIPASMPTNDQKLILSDTNNRAGVLSYGVPWTGSELGTSLSAKVSTPLWMIESVYEGLRYDYNFYNTRMAVFPATDWDGGDITYDDQGVGYQIFKSANSVSLNGLNLSGTQKVILLVNGNVSVDGNLVTPDGTFLAIIARGNITFSSDVAQAQGWFVAENINVPCKDATGDGCDGDDTQFDGQGSFVGWTNVVLSRDMGVGNNSNPSEKFTYRPDLFENAPAPMKVFTKKYSQFVP